ncbi:MAG: DNA translocase FtsK 4TM domain-containing protein, partial [Nitrospirota bacterium]|nr:DNA translocase FtsK 4TM domain-containing protein [Nitrospirota bacterium]
MAVSSAPRGERISIAELMSRRAGEVLGIGLAFAALILAIALWGHDASDPSLNNATAGPSSNPLGGFGASVADLCLQTLGMAAWIPVLVLPCWGVRLFLGRPLDLPWLPILALPPALLAAAAYLATLEVPQSWPYWVGLGGFVGDFALHRVERMVGAQHYPLLALLAAVGLLIVALGVSMREIWHAVRAVPALVRGDAREGAIRGGRQQRLATALRRPIGGPGLDDQAGGRPPASGFSFVGSFVGGLASRLKPAEGGLPPMAPVRPEPAAAETAERPVRRRPGAARPAEPERQPSLDLGAVHRVASELAESPAAELVPGQDFQLPPLKFLSMPRTRRSISV